MSKNKGTFLIGLFVLIGSAILIGLIIFLSATQFFDERKLYVTYFNTSVEGLENGSAVKYQGVPCGRINAIKVAPDGKLVEVIMQIDKKISINDSLRVQSALSGIAGGKFLQLSYPTPEMSVIYPKIDFEPPYPLIKSSPSSLEEITLAAQQVMNNLLEVDANSISHGMVNALANANRFLSNPDLFTTISNLNKSSDLLVSVISKINESNVFENANNSSDLLLKTSQQLQVMVDTLTTQIVKMELPIFVDKVYIKYDSLINQTSSSISNLGFRSEASLMTIQETLEQIKITNRYLQKTLRTLSDNPSAIFLTEPAPKDR